MSLEYRVIEVHTREGQRWHHMALHEAVLKSLAELAPAARAIVIRGVGGVFEGGEIVSQRAVDMAAELPIKTEIVLPAADVGRVLSALEEMVREGLIVIRDGTAAVHRTGGRLFPRGLRVRDAMSSAPVSIAPQTSVHDVVHVLAEHEFNAVPVVEDGRVVGIICQGDLLTRADMPLRVGLLAEYDRLERERLVPSGERPAAEIMSSPVVTVEDEDPLEEAIEVMVERGLKRLPVVDRDGLLRGMLSRVDVLGVLGEHASGPLGPEHEGGWASGRTPVGDLAYHDTPVVAPDTPLFEVLGLIDARSQRVVVVDPNRRVVGLVSDRDLLRTLSHRHKGMVDFVRRSLAGRSGKWDRRHERALRQLTAADVMNSEVISIREDDPVIKALRLMTAHRLKRLPVTSPTGAFVGVLSRERVMRVGLASGQIISDQAAAAPGAPGGADGGT
jgi:CBS domain-containing protein